MPISGDLKSGDFFARHHPPPPTPTKKIYQPPLKWPPPPPPHCKSYYHSWNGTQGREIRGKTRKLLSWFVIGSTEIQSDIWLYGRYNEQSLCLFSVNVWLKVNDAKTRIKKQWNKLKNPKLYQFVDMISVLVEQSLWKVQSHFLSGRFDDPYRRPGDSFRIRETSR